jgi:hypothetical protein
MPPSDLGKFTGCWARESGTIPSRLHASIRKVLPDGVPVDAQLLADLDHGRSSLIERHQMVDVCLTQLPGPLVRLPNRCVIGSLQRQLLNQDS